MWKYYQSVLSEEEWTNGKKFLGDFTGATAQFAMHAYLMFLIGRRMLEISVCQQYKNEFVSLGKVEVLF